MAFARVSLCEIMQNLFDLVPTQFSSIAKNNRKVHNKASCVGYIHVIFIGSSIVTNLNREKFHVLFREI